MSGPGFVRRRPAAFECGHSALRRRRREPGRGAGSLFPDHVVRPAREGTGFLSPIHRPAPWPLGPARGRRGRFSGQSRGPAWNLRRNLRTDPMPPRRVVAEFLYPGLPPAEQRFVAPGLPVDLRSIDPGGEVDLLVTADLRATTSAWMPPSPTNSAPAASSSTATPPSPKASPPGSATAAWPQGDWIPSPSPERPARTKGNRVPVPDPRRDADGVRLGAVRLAPKAVLGSSAGNGRSSLRP